MIEEKPLCHHTCHHRLSLGPAGLVGLDGWGWVAVSGAVCSDAATATSRVAAGWDGAAGAGAAGAAGAADADNNVGDPGSRGTGETRSDVGAALGTSSSATERARDAATPTTGGPTARTDAWSCQ
jgi:hypothetical protein